MAAHYFDACTTLRVSPETVPAVEAENLTRLLLRYGIREAIAHAEPVSGMSIKEINQWMLAAAKATPRLRISWLFVPEISGGRPLSDEIDAIKSAKIGIVRLTPRRHGYQMTPSDLAKEFQSFEENRFLLFLDYETIHWSETIQDAEILDELCSAYPRLPIILIRRSLADAQLLLPVMKKHPNLYLETSYYQPGDGITDAARRGLGQQLLLGSGLPCWEAAGPISALAYADLDLETFTDIAGRNLKRLLRLQAGADAFLDLPNLNHGFKILDAHGYYGPIEDVYSPAMDFCRIDDIFMRCGVSAQCVSSVSALRGQCNSGNQALAQAILQSDGRLKGYYVPDPQHPECMRASLERDFAAMGMSGINIHCNWTKLGISHPDWKPALQFADERQLSVLVHSNEPPEQVKSICARYPHLRLLLAHAGGLGIDDASPWYELAREAPNLYLDTCSSLCHRGAFESLIRKYGPEKILFASDFPYLDLAYQLGRIFGADLRREVKQKILYDNAVEFFRLSVP